MSSASHLPDVLAAGIALVDAWETRHASLPGVHAVAKQARESLRSSLPVAVQGSEALGFHLAWVVGAYAQETNLPRVFFLKERYGRLQGLVMDISYVERGPIDHAVNRSLRWFDLERQSHSSKIGKGDGPAAANIKRRLSHGQPLGGWPGPDYHVDMPTDLTQQCRELLHIHLVYHQRERPEALRHASSALFGTLDDYVTTLHEEQAPWLAASLDAEAWSRAAATPSPSLAYNYLKSPDAALNDIRLKALRDLAPWPFFQHLILIEMEGDPEHRVRQGMPLAACLIDEGVPALEAVRQDIVSKGFALHPSLFECFRQVRLNSFFDLFPEPENRFSKENLHRQFSISSVQLLYDLLTFSTSLPLYENERLWERMPPLLTPGEQTLHPEALAFFRCFYMAQNASHGLVTPEAQRRFLGLLMLTIPDWAHEFEMLQKDFPSIPAEVDAKEAHLGYLDMLLDAVSKTYLPVFLNMLEDRLHQRFGEKKGDAYFRRAVNRLSFHDVQIRLAEAFLPEMLGDSLHAFLKRSERWHDADFLASLRRQAGIGAGALHWPALSPSYHHGQTGLNVAPLTSQAELHAVGAALGHNLPERVSRLIGAEERHLLAVYQGDMPIASAELHPLLDSFYLMIDERTFAGPGDPALSRLARKALEEYANALNRSAEFPFHLLEIGNMRFMLSEKEPDATAHILGFDRRDAALSAQAREAYQRAFLPDTLVQRRPGEDVIAEVVETMLDELFHGTPQLAGGAPALQP